MTQIAIREEMLQYFSQLDKEEQRDVIALIRKFIDSRKVAGRQTLDEYSEELEKANADIEAGNYTNHEDVKKMFSK